MSETSNLSDIAYCQEVLADLKTLEDNAQKREALAKEVSKQINRELYRLATFFALILPLLLVLIFFVWRLGGRGLHTTASQLIIGIFGLFILCGILFVNIYALFIYLYRKNIFKLSKHHVRKHVYAQIAPTRLAIQRELRRTIAKDSLTASRIPDRYLSTRAVLLLVETLKSYPAMSLEGAVERLNTRIQNEAYGANLLGTGETFIFRQQKNLVYDFLDGLFDYDKR